MKSAAKYLGVGSSILPLLKVSDVFVFLIPQKILPNFFFGHVRFENFRTVVSVAFEVVRTRTTLII
jgi:hypothetical protein